jgi:hypothetical protein
MCSFVEWNKTIIFNGLLDIHNMQLPKSYFLPRYRSRIIGATLIVMGFGLTFGFVDLNSSIWDNLQMMFISFEDVGTFIISFIILPFKILLIVGGWFYIKNSDGLERARLDEQGFYYRRIEKGYRYTRVLMDYGPLTFIPYTNIKVISYRKSIWLGGLITLHGGGETLLLPALNVLKEQEKKKLLITLIAGLSLKIIKFYNTYPILYHILNQQLATMCLIRIKL